MILIRSTELCKILGVGNAALHQWYRKGYLGTKFTLSFGARGGRATYFGINWKILDELENARLKGKILVTKEALKELEELYNSMEGAVLERGGKEKTLQDEIDRILNEFKKQKESMKAKKEEASK